MMKIYTHGYGKIKRSREKFYEYLKKGRQIAENKKDRDILNDLEAEFDR